MNLAKEISGNDNNKISYAKKYVHHNLRRTTVGGCRRGCLRECWVCLRDNTDVVWLTSRRLLVGV